MLASLFETKQFQEMSTGCLLHLATEAFCQIDQFLATPAYAYCTQLNPLKEKRDPGYLKRNFNASGLKVD